MKILVTGATGFLGGHIVSELKRKKFDVKCLVRKDSNVSGLKKMRVSLVYGDIKDKRTLKAAVKDADVILHMAAVVKSSSKKLYYDVNYRGTKNLVEVCKENKIRRIIHISTHDVVFAKGDYSISKLKGEKVINNSKLKFTIIRPTAIYGEGGSSLKSLVRLVRNSPIVPILGSGNNKLQPVYVRDVVDTIIKVIRSGNTSNKTIGKTYVLGGPDKITFNELIDLIMKEIGVKKPKVHVPIPLIKNFASIYGKITSKPFITVDSIELLTYDKISDNSAAIKDLRYRPIGLKRGIKQLVKA